MRPSDRCVDTNVINKRIRRTPALLKQGVVRIDAGKMLVDVHEMALRFPDLKQNPLGGKPRGRKPKPKIKPEANTKAKRAKRTATGAPEAKQRAAVDEPSDREVDTVMDYTEARASKEKWNARMAKINFQKEAGKLIPADAVAKAWTDIATVTQKSVLSVPDRIAPLLVGEMDQAIIHKRITDEIRYALKNLSFTLTGTGDAPQREEANEKN